MSAETQPRIEHRLSTVRELYSELFILLDQSLVEEPDAARGGSLDRTIEHLMNTIEGEMKDLRRDVDEARRGRPLDAPLDEAIVSFDAQLREGLTLLADCVKRRVAQLSQAREALKARLQAVHARQRGARGYRGGAERRRTLESHI